MLEAKFWESGHDEITCTLCSHSCSISGGSSGACGVRFNHEGVLVSPYLGRFCAVGVDPVEKKPLFHWRPGTFIYSLGSVGCNMNCPFCQNHTIAKPESYNRFDSVPFLSVNDLVRNIRAYELSSAAFTYNEPTLQAEYILSCAHVLSEAGISIALVTNGMMSKQSLPEFISCLSETKGAANIDIKAFTNEAYTRLGGSLEAVKSNISAFIHAGIHTELTHLVVPGINDNPEDFAEMSDWISSLSPDIPLHITRYFPARRYSRPSTPIDTLHEFCTIARSKLRHVHIGNV